MAMGNITQKVLLLQKTIGIKRGYSFFTEDVYRFINNKGENNVYTVFRDEQQRAVRSTLKNETTGAIKDRIYSYHKYKFKNGETVPYKRVKTTSTDGSGHKTERVHEVIATAQNGQKRDVTISRRRFTQQNTNENIIEENSLLRFSNGKKPIGIICNIEKTPDNNIISKKTLAIKNNGKKVKIIPDMFYNLALYDDITFKSEVIKALKSEMGLKNYGIVVKPAHLGYTPGGHNTYAHYNHSKKTVSINVDIPIVNTRRQFASEVAHELTHAWQHREVELLEQGLLSGARKEAAQVYKNEFLNYIRGSATDKTQTAKYKSQVVETKAREFQKFVEQYYNQNLKNIYNKYVQGIIPPQIGISTPLPVGTLNHIV